jgi:hypothetical protein
LEKKGWTTEGQPEQIYVKTLLTDICETYFDPIGLRHLFVDLADRYAWFNNIRDEVEMQEYTEIIEELYGSSKDQIDVNLTLYEEQSPEKI